MAVTDFIAAIELGSTHITGIAGKKNADGSIQILAYANTPSSDCIKKGAVLEQTGHEPEKSLFLSPLSPDPWDNFGASNI